MSLGHPQNPWILGTVTMSGLQAPSPASFSAVASSSIFGALCGQSSSSRATSSRVFFAVVLNRRLPCVPPGTQARDMLHGGTVKSHALARTLERARASVSLLDKLNLLSRTAEMARLFGIPFYEVMNRGSQYRVEAVMLRVLKPLQYTVVSPSKDQVAGQAAMEVIPLVRDGTKEPVLHGPCHCSRLPEPIPIYGSRLQPVLHDLPWPFRETCAPPLPPLQQQLEKERGRGRAKMVWRWQRRKSPPPFTGRQAALDFILFLSQPSRDA